MTEDVRSQCDAGCACRYTLTGSAKVILATGMSHAEIRKAPDVVRANRLHFLSEWRRIHG